MDATAQPAALKVLRTSRWDGVAPDEAGDETVDALERGEILYFPQLPFEFTADEKPLLSPATSDGKSKNVVYDIRNDSLHGTALTATARETLHALMRRYAQSTTRLIENVLPGYAADLEIARTSFRPVRVEGRPSSYKKDDTRLHVDAFSATPNQGRRILRVFSNVNPEGEPRRWEVGEPFEAFAPKFIDRIPLPSALSGALLEHLRLTRGRRTPYDHVMLQLHDRGKADMAYQKASPKTAVAFPPGTTWIVFTDRVMHAALGGQHLLEQTFHLPVAAMHRPERSPLRILEGLYQRPLA
ncbi:MAG: Kdo hydroxylase family protein [Burkholderiales bacterium]